MKIKLILVVLFVAGSVLPQVPKRSIAVTIDDLPVVSTRRDLKNRQEITKKLLAHIKSAKVPAIGFVNEGKLYKGGVIDKKEVELLQKWIDGGLELGNHTYSHMSLHDNSLEDYKADILKGEKVTKELLAAKKMKMRYFRHPYLWTGLSLEIKADLGEFLSLHEYTIAPVTIDNSDWIFARAYDKALEANDLKLQSSIGETYVSYLELKMDYWERQSIRLFEREIKHILLLHANALNSDYFDDLAKMLRQRAYVFITIESALEDDVYKLPDTFVKRNGISWLHRWALEKGKEYILPDEPKVPEFVLKAAGISKE